MAKNPFSPKTASYQDFETMKDLEWHCTRCELKSAQAKTWQIWRQTGLQLDTDENGHLYKKMLCPKCGSKTIHRKLLSLDLSEDTSTRSTIPPRLAKKIKELFNYEEALFLRKLLPNELEIDHRFPQVRWIEDEALNPEDMSEQDIKSKFILLSRSNNLLKSRNCERCVKTGQRGKFPGIDFWYSGSDTWDRSIRSHDERGCIGCFWYDPYAWREELRRKLSGR